MSEEISGVTTFYEYEQKRIKNLRNSRLYFNIIDRCTFKNGSRFLKKPSDDDLKMKKPPFPHSNYLMSVVGSIHSLFSYLDELVGDGFFTKGMDSGVEVFYPTSKLINKVFPHE